MLNGYRRSICARSLWLTLLLLALSATSWAQYLSFTEYSVPTSNSLPGCITNGPDGALWFTEAAGFANNIGRLTTAGVVTEYPIPTTYSKAYCITNGPDGALWFTESNSDKIGRITTFGAITEYPIPTPSATPWGITPGPDDALWFVERTGNQIGRITTAGTITEYPIPTAASLPVSIAAGADGALWFTESSGNKIGRITTAGVISEFAVPTAASSPWGITAGPDGALWFTMQAGNAIGRITTAGVITGYSVPTSGAAPWGITSGPDGALWFTERQGNNIARISTAGAVTEYPIPAGPGNPFGITTGPDGALWFTDDGPNSVIRSEIVPQSPPLSIFTQSPLPNGFVGVSYAQTLSATGGAPPYTWSVSAGSLPAGLTLGPVSGQITGTPTASGLASFTVTVTDTSQSTASAPFSVTIDADDIVQFPFPLTTRFGGITAGPDGALWFTEQTSMPFPNQAGRITTLGATTEYPVLTCECAGPNGIAPGPDGALWFGQGVDVGRITTAGAVTGYLVPNSFNIYGIVTGPDGALWFTDAFLNFIGRITTEGAVTTYPVPTHGNSDGIYSIASGSDGALWFTEKVGYIGRISTAGVVTEFPVPAVPIAIAAGPDGALWYADANGAIGRITTTGLFTEYPTPTAGSSPAGITAGPDGAMWFTESATSRIGRISMAGAITEYPIPTADVGAPGSIATGPDGALWFTQIGPNGGAIGRLLPPPTLISINPASGAQGQTVPVTLTGSGFVVKATTVHVPSGITVSNVKVVSSTQATAIFTIAANAAIGPSNVTVATIAGASSPVTFTITPPLPSAPSLTSISPASGVQGAIVPVTLTGTNFITGPTITGTNFFDDYTQLVPFTQTPTLVDNGLVSVTSTVYPDPTDTNSQWVDFNFQSVNSGPLASNPSGLWQVFLANVPLTSPGSYTGLQYYWTVNGVAADNITPIAGLNPVVTNLINPALGLAYGSTFQGGNSLSVFNVSAELSDYAAALQTGSMNPSTINGFHIAARTTGGVFGGATVSVANPGVSVSNLTLVSATQITATFNIAANAALGQAAVAVSTAGGTSQPPPTVTFTVLPPPPTITSISPSSGTVGTVISATLNGSNFVSGGTTVNVTGGVTVSNLVVVGSGQLTVTLTIPPSATPGPVNVTLSTAGGTAGPIVFTIDPALLITTKSPLPSGTVGTAYSQTVSLSGGTAPYSWMLTAGTLPAGLSLSQATCINSQGSGCLISGTPVTSGAASFTLKVSDASGATASAAFALTVNPAPLPTITSIKPSSGTQGTSVPVSIVGTNFAPGASISISNSGVTVSNVVVASATQITAAFTIAADATLGAANVVATTPQGTTLPAVFTVLPPPPVLTLITPATGASGTIVQVTLTGSNFATGAIVAAGSSSVTVSNTAVLSSTRISATLNIAANALVGPVNITVSTPSGATSSPVIFTITSLRLTSISPASGAQGATVPIVLNGSGFAAGAQVVTSSSGVVAGSTTVINSSQLTASLKISPTAFPGPINVSVIVGGVTSDSVVFIVSPSGQLTLQSISPAYGAQGATVPVTLTGTGFAAGDEIAIGGPGVTASRVVVVDTTQITATFTVGPNAAPGVVYVAVITPGGSSGPQPFTVLAPLTLTSISPSAGVQGSTVAITLTGTGFAPGAVIATNSSGVTPGSVIVSSSTQITATLKISASAQPGPVGITVISGGATSAAVTFTVNSATQLTLTSIAPASGAPGASVPITLTGTGFAAGDQVTAGSSSVSVSNVVIVSATQITATFTIGADAAPGAVNVAVTMPGGTSGSVVFTILAPLKLTSITPPAGVQGASVAITLAGSGFAAGAQVLVNNSGVTPANIVVVSSTQITATFNISPTAAAGPANVTVTLAGVTSAPVTFTVNPAAPTLTAISVDEAPQGASFSVTLTGTNFVSGAALIIANSGVTAGSIVVVSSTQIDATLTIAAGAALGGTSISVSTPAGVSGPLGFTVDPALVFSLDGLPGTISSGQQISFKVSIGQPSPVDVSGTLNLQFTPGQSLPSDPTIALLGGICTSGTCSVNFTIPASQTSVSESLQTGTVSGSLMFSVVDVSVAGTGVSLSNNPPINAVVSAQAPTITDVSIQPGSSGFSIVVTGFSNDREITEADFTFTPTTGSQLQTSTFSLTSAAPTFQTYYASDASLLVGSEFVYTQTFNVNTGSISTLQSVTVVLKNTQGASSGVTAKF